MRGRAPRRPARGPARACRPDPVRVLAVSDEVDDALLADPSAARGVELILACGDLPMEYLGSLMDCLEVPLVFVPGNHDPDLSGYRISRAGLTLRAGMPVRPPWPDGAVSADGRLVDVAGLRVAGLGGCRRYSGGPSRGGGSACGMCGLAFSARPFPARPGRAAAGPPPPGRSR